MKIELNTIDDSITLLEHVIREQDRKEDGEVYSNHAFQANVKITKIAEGDLLFASFSYYDENGEFLGLDEDELWSEKFMHNRLNPLSIDLNIPKNTYSVKCQFRIDKHKLSFWDYGWKLFALLVFGLLVSHIIKIWM